MARGSSEVTLRQVRHEDLLSLAQTLGVLKEAGSPRPAKDRLAPVIARVIDDPRWVQGALAALDMEDALIVARWVWFSSGALPYRRPYLPDRYVNERRLAPLARTGIILAVSGAYGVPTYVVPPVAEEVILRWSWRLHAQDRPPNVFRSSEDLVDLSPGRGPLAVTEIVRLLGALHRKPARLTQKGTIYKKDAEVLGGAFHPLWLDDISPAFAALDAACGVTPNYFRCLGTPFLDRVDLVMELLATAKLLVRDGDTLAARPGWAAWFEGGLQAAWSHVVDVAMRVLEIHGRLTLQLVSILAEGEQWLRPAAFFRDVLGMESSYGALLSVGLGIRTLWWLGLIDIALEGGDPVIRLNGEARAMIASKGGAIPAEDSFIVSPGGQVLAPPRLDPSVQATLERLSDIERVDTASTYRLSQTRIWAELERGEEKASIRSFLESRAKGGLPQAVAYDIEEWIRRYTRVAFADMKTLYCEDEALLTRLLALPTASRFFTGRLNPHHAIVLDGREEALRKALASAGFHVARGTDHPGRVNGVRAPSGDRQLIDDMIADLLHHLGEDDGT